MGKKITKDTPYEERSPISASDWKKCGEFLYHGTKRDLDITSLGIHVCKNRANRDIEVPVVYMHRLYGIACAHIVPFMIGHGSKMKNYQEHILQLDKAASLSREVNFVEIVHNDESLSPVEGETTGYVYCVKKEDCKDALYYATPDDKKNWLFVSYKQLPIAEKRKVTVKWKKHYDANFAKKISNGHMVVEGFREDDDNISFEDVATEVLSEKGKDKRKRIIAHIVKVMDTLDPSGDNGRRYQNLLGKMSDNDFIRFMTDLSKGAIAINIIMPNMKKSLKIHDLIRGLSVVDLNVYHKLWLTDVTTGRKYLTNEKYLVLQLPIRRAQQEVDKKLSVPSRDQRIDALTGQVSGPDRACALSAPEIQSLNTRGLEATLNELVRVRGGDINAYGDFKRQLEETGGAELNALDPRTRTRSSVIAKVLLTALLFDNNL